MKFAVVEGEASGHRLSYVSRLFRDTTWVNGQLRVLTTSSALESAEWHHFLCEDGQEFEVELLEKGSLRVPSIPDDEYLVIPDGDRWLLRAALSRPPGQGGALLIMRPGSSGQRGWVAYWGKATLARLCQLMGWRVGLLVSPGSRGGEGVHLGFRGLPRVRDPLPEVEASRGEFRRRHELDDSRVLCLCAGVIDRRKSPLEIVDWLEHSSIDGLVVAFVGRCHSSVEAVFARSDNQNLIVDNRFLTDRELAEAYVDADVILALYTNQGSSGALAHALRYRVPVVAWGSKLVTSVVSRLGVGAVARSRTPRDLDSAVVHALSVQRGHESGFDSVVDYPGRFLREISGR